MPGYGVIQTCCAFSDDEYRIDCANLCIVDKNEVLVWGFGALGVGPSVKSASAPQAIPPTLFGQNELAPDKLVKDIACGINHFAARTSVYLFL